MRRALSLLIALSPLSAMAQPDALTVTVEDVAPGGAIPPAQALCLPTADGKSNAEGKNQRPTIRWSGAPEGTASIALFIMDPDVPADFSDAGKEGKTIAVDAKRQDFYHYGVIGIPATATELKGGHSSARPGTELVNDMGLNQYVPTPTAYGGPCPPWNDARVHHYHFIVLALAKDAPVTASVRRNIERSSENPNTAKNTFNRLMESGQVLAHGTTIGTYTLNKAATTNPTRRAEGHP